MAKVKPFAALRPAKEKAGEVSAPPFDSGSKEQAYYEITHNPISYLHVVKPYLHFKGERKNPEKHFPIGLEYLKKFIADGLLIKDEKPVFYIYRLIKGSQAYAGIIAMASVDDYYNDNILKHENTLTDKQNEIAEHIHFYKNLGNPVLLTYPDDQSIDLLLNQYILRHVPEYNFISHDQIKHNLWVVTEEKDIELLETRFEAIDKLYIADGHHRTAGSAAFCEIMRKENPNYTGEETFNYFPVCLIPFSKLTIFEYHRLVRDKAKVDDKHFLEQIKQYFEAIPSGHLPVQPLNKREFGIYFHGKAYLLLLKEEFASQIEGTLDALDVSIVEKFILQNIFQIKDSKTDHRLSFMDGGKGIGHLQEVVDNGEFDLAITLYPTSIEEVKQVAEEKLIMPPKSTWIEPKIRTGLIILDHA
ncbi:MAG: hypothetical protein CFE21_13030 [Bacteroidetes bacterium B1(2017)]|nr:MAG: hypothetical protein CFE21_13030 [Bacteroidetes bacterium B1(2017)]